jgi:predicted tellurium resistance membrane protein TerC
MTVGSLGNFWATVCLVELMDMAFSIDNVFAAVAFTPNIILVCIGVFIGILAMRFIAQWFVKLMEKYNFLETAAFIVIGILGLKLLLSLYEHFYPTSYISEFFGSHTADIGISILTVAIFFVPILTSLFFNWPAKSKIENE